MTQLHGFILFFLLIILAQTRGKSTSETVKCGTYDMEVGEVLTIKGNNTPCTWKFQAPPGGKIMALCSNVRIYPNIVQCKKASMEISSPGKPTVKFCGRQQRLTIDRSTASLTIRNRLKTGGRNQYNCDIYLKMSTNVTATCDCGIENPPVSRIVGGNVTGVGQYPWVGGITYRRMKRLFCSMVLLTDSHGITAAHCLHTKKQERLIVVLAEHNSWNVNDTPRTIRRISKIVYHPQHRPEITNYGDLAIVTFDHPVSLHHWMVRPVCLPTADAPDYAGWMGTTAGWGSTDSDPGGYSKKLQAVDVRLWKNSDCRETGFGKHIHDDLVCAGYPKGGKDACFGDSGGPLTIVKSGRHILVGTASFGHGCALPGWPGVYARISGSIDWINSKTEKGIHCQSLPIRE